MKRSLYILIAALPLAGCGGLFQSTGNHHGTDSALSSEALAISNSDFVAGYGTDAQNNKHAVLFVQTGQQAPAGYTVTDIGNLGGSQTVVNAMSNTGKATGWSFTASNEVHAFRYDGSMTDLGFIQLDTGSIGRAINDAGDVVGESIGPNATHPILVLHNDEFHQIPTPDGQNNGGLTGINNGDVMVGVYLTSNLEVHTFSDTVNDPSVDLQPLGVEGLAAAINNNAYIVGDQSPTGGWWYQETIAYTHLPNHGGRDHNPIHAVNDNQVIAGADLFGTHLHAVTYTNGVKKDLGVLGDTGVVDLNTLISGSDQATYGRLTEATGITTTGKICCNTTSGKAVILTPTP